MRVDRKKESGKLAALSLALAVSALVTMQQSQAAKGSFDGWNVNLSSNYAGTVMTQLTMQGIRMKMDKMGLLVVTKAPKWDLYVYNETNHNYYELPYSEWKNKLSFGKFHGGPKGGVVKPVPEKTNKTMTLQGHKAQEYIVKRENPHTKKLENAASIWMTTEIQAPPQFSQLVHNFLNVPEVKGTPLRVTQVRNGKTVQDLDAYKIEKASLPESLFEPLKGYKRVKDEMALMLDEGDMDLVGGMH